ncbi:MAG TPA: hypothetical protein VLF66_13365 [Thermoanaerobaculia bacterium]|nr:hypothetical protein [Thermoanaerobaculia bacterium]
MTVAVAVEAHEADHLLAEIDRFAASLASPEARSRYGRLREAVAGGSRAPVPDELVPALEDLLEIALGSRSVHRFHGPGAEAALRALHARTPRGATLEEAARTATRALEALRGQRIERLAFAPGLPGSHRLSIETDRCRLTLEIGRAGVSVRDLAL